MTVAAVRIIALLASYNEERFIGLCLEHLRRHQIDAYLLDNSSTDGTVTIAEKFLGRGLIAIESIERDGVYRLARILRRKEELAATLEADWFLHMDPDEVRLPPRPDVTLRGALEDVDRQDYNSVNFLEFTFSPTLQAPNHDHPRFLNTMRSYYPFLPFFPHRLNAWKRQEMRVDLVSSGGHVVKFSEQRIYPESFLMRHYLFLSVDHAVEKYVEKKFDPEAVRKGWHGWRADLTRDAIRLPEETEMRHYGFDMKLDATAPRQSHLIANGEKTRETSQPRSPPAPERQPAPRAFTPSEG